MYNATKNDNYKNALLLQMSYGNKTIIICQLPAVFQNDVFVTRSLFNNAWFHRIKQGQNIGNVHFFHTPSKLGTKYPTICERKYPYSTLDQEDITLSRWDCLLLRVVLRKGKVASEGHRPLG